MFNFFKKRPATLVFFVTFLIYCPILLNNFVGDDAFIITRNSFYSSWNNIPRLFKSGYIVNSNNIIFNTELRSDLGTGSVSYRPISNVSYFLDGCLFQSKPYGSHLINILVHAINAVLVYWIVCRVFSSSALAVFAALLFSLHPIQAEAVAVMSFRADIIAAMFALSSFYFWIRFKEREGLDKGYYYRSLGMCCLALFSKESTVMLPFVIILFDQLVAKPRLTLRKLWFYYLGFLPILGVYLYLYIIVFSNSSLVFHWLGGSFVKHILIMGNIWYKYLVNLLLPWTVTLVPALYCPPAQELFSLKSIEILITLMLFIGALLLCWYRYKEITFFVVWYLIFYIPVSNLIPIANPIACRFMYLPSIGLLIALAFVLQRSFNSSFIRMYSRYLSMIFQMAVLMVCVTRLLFINGDLKSNFDACWAWVRDYPSYGRAYALLGREYLTAGDFKNANEYLKQGILLGDSEPDDSVALAASYLRLGETAEAEGVLKNIIVLYPDYALPYSYLGQIYFNKKDNQQAQEMLEKALRLNPREASVYLYLMKMYINLGKIDAAKDVLESSKSYLDMQSVANLRNLLKE